MDYLSLFSRHNLYEFLNNKVAVTFFSYVLSHTFHIYYVLDIFLIFFYCSNFVSLILLRFNLNGQFQVKQL